MGEYADDMIYGFACQNCGVYFEEEHGYPVSCEGCYNSMTKEQRKDVQKAIYAEL